ncbi:MAG: hypothetical protein L6R40_002168 [Gallowayella cf. fulva]|nr:MAG: hypothetical protein L6R40_002168 [Xanthomendoza cf. fulva]
MDSLIGILQAQLHTHIDTTMTLGEKLTALILLTSTVTGALFLFSKLYNLIRLLFSLFILPGKPLRTFGLPSSYAIITGASDGLGKEFALHLSRAPFNLLLISRTGSKLDALAHQIRSQNRNIDVRTLAFDFGTVNDASSSSSHLQPLRDAIEELEDIAILINNVGKSHDIPVPFIETEEKEMRDIININCLSTLLTTAIVAPRMVKQKRGLILTMGSFGGLMPTPLLATYSGSKAFLQKWSTALGSELQPHGVTVEVVQSYLVTSAMSKIRRPSLMIPSAKAFVRSVLTSVGRTGGAQGWGWTSTPWWTHAIMQWGVSGLAGLDNKLVLGVNKEMHEGIRKKALRKKERDSKKGN